MNPLIMYQISLTGIMIFYILVEKIKHLGKKGKYASFDYLEWLFMYMAATIGGISVYLLISIPDLLTSNQY